MATINDVIKFIESSSQEDRELVESYLNLHSGKKAFAKLKSWLRVGDVVMCTDPHLPPVFKGIPTKATVKRINTNDVFVSMVLPSGSDAYFLTRPNHIQRIK